MSFALERLSDGDRRRIAAELYKVKTTYDKTGEMPGWCPIHTDEHPSFSYNYLKDIYHCYACGISGDLVDLYCKVRGLPNDEGFKRFCDEYGIDIGSKYKSAEAAEKEEDLEAIWRLFVPLTDKWIERMGLERGWSAAAITQLDLRLQTHFRSAETGKLVAMKEPERIAVPVRDKSGRLRNIRLYKPGAKEMKIISWGKGLGKSRLFPASPGDASPILLCEGEADAICAFSQGFNAITQTSKTKSWEPAHREPFRGRDVVIAYDADTAGDEYAKWAAKSLAGTARTIRLLEWPDWMGRLPDGSWPEKHGQDLTDYFVRHGRTAEDLRTLIITAKLYNEDSGKVESIESEFFETGPNNRLSFKSRLLAGRIMRDVTICFDTSTGKLYRWNEQFWEEYEEDHLRKMAIQYLGLEAQKSRVEDAVYQTMKLSALPYGRAMNDRSDWVCIKNGMLNLMTLKLKPFEKDYYMTYQLPVTFDPDSPARCTRFLQFLEETIKTPGPIMQLQEFMGYCLVRHCRYEKALILLGPGADGKSKIIKLLRLMVGPENCSAVSFGDLEKSFQRSTLYNRLINVSTEIGDKTLQNEFFKAIVSGDPINAEFKNKDAFEFLPFCKLVFSTNKLPRMHDNTDGYFRKLLVILMKEQFLEDNPRRDENLEDKLAAELSEVFNFALVGLHRLIEQHRFTDCDEARDNILKYRRLNNPVLCFIDDECQEGGSCEKVELFKRYKKYCDENGYKPLGREGFWREVHAARDTLHRSRPRVDGKRVDMISGLSLRDTGSPPPPPDDIGAR